MADAANVLLMLSGGPDSATLAGFVARELAARNPPHAIYLRSGHPADKKEIEAAEQIAGRIGSRLEIVDIPELLHALQSDRLMTPSENSIVPFGNAIALSLMMLCAIRARADAHLCRLSSRRRGRERRLRAASHGSAGIVGRRSIVTLAPKIIAPFLNMTKTEVFKLGAAMGVPYDLTWSCLRAGASIAGNAAPAARGAAPLPMPDWSIRRGIRLSSWHRIAPAQARELQRKYAF